MMAETMRTGSLKDHQSQPTCASQAGSAASMELGLEVPEVIDALDRVVQERPDEAREAAHAVIRRLAGQAQARQVALQATYAQLRQIEAGIRGVQGWLAEMERRSAPPAGAGCSHA